tara:strand:+ start:57 stop:521 length:465 start_codon:yes stop_codon:yes gene_type:complete
MANNASNYLEEKILQHIFNSNSSHSAFTAPADNAIFISLHSTAGPLDANSGTATEVPLNGATATDYGYTRGGGTVSDLTWTVAESGGTVTAKNNEAIVFPQATNNYPAQITHIGIYDAASTGNLLFHGQLTVPKTVTQGDTFQINANSLVITLE